MRPLGQVFFSFKLFSFIIFFFILFSFIIFVFKLFSFIYYNCYTNDFNDILDFYNTFSNNKNICVVGIFENRNDKKMLFESSNCKIYQNYDRNFIFNEIKSAF